MIELILVGIGTGNPDHLTLQAIKALNSADLVMIPRKGVNRVMDELYALGARAILVTAIHAARL